MISLWFVGGVEAVDYYVNATTGNDSLAGTSSALAWKTIAMINNHTFNPGDNIYFERGQTWREMLTVPSSGNATDYITFGAYGSGEKPIIKRTELTSNWWQLSLLESGSFERFTEGSPSDSFTKWSPSVGGGGDPNNNYVQADTGYSGYGTSTSARLYSIGSGAWIKLFASGDVTVDAETQYFISIVGQISENSTLRFRVQDTTNLKYLLNNGSWGNVSSYAFSWDNETSDMWVEKNISFTTLAGATTLELAFYNFGVGNSYVDDVYFNNGTSKSSSKVWSTYIPSYSRHYGAVNESVRLLKGSSVLNISSALNISNDYTAMGGGALSSYYFYRLDSETPYNIELGCRLNGIVIDSQNYVIVDNINVFGPAGDASQADEAGHYLIKINGTSNTVEIKNLTVSYGSDVGIRSTNTTNNVTYDGVITTQNRDTGMYMTSINGIIQNSSSYNNGNLITDSGDKGGIGLQSGTIIVQNNEIYDNGNNIDGGDAGISAVGTTKVIIRYNRINASRNGILIAEGGNDSEIYYNIIDGFNMKNINAISAGIKIGGGSLAAPTGVMIYNNIINNGSAIGSTASIYLEYVVAGSLANAKLKNNLFYNSSSPDIIIESLITTTGYDFSNNNYYKSNYADNWRFNGTNYNTLANWQGAIDFSIKDTNSITSNPLLVSSTDFQLLWNSSAIDAGTDVSLTSDYDGNPIYGTPDIGAYEYQPPYNSSLDKINYSSVRVYGDGKYRRIASSDSIIGANFTINSIGSNNKSLFIDINITTWNTSGTYYKNWTEDGSTSENVSHTVADLKANTSFTVKVDSVAGRNITGANCTSGLCLSDASGKITFNYTGGYSSHVFEVVDATAPTPSFSCTPTSVRTGQTITCSCTATDDVDSSPSVLYTTNPSTVDTGTYTTTCTATDDAGNSASSSISYTVESINGGSGGTSSGSSYTNTIIQDKKEFSEIKTITQELKSKERVRIKINDEEHHIGVAELTNTTATIEIFSTTQKAVLNIGEEKKFEVTEDEYYDIYVKLNSIENNKANLTIISIHEQIPIKEKPITEDVVEDIEEEEERNITWLWIVIGFVLLVVIGVGVRVKGKK